MKARKPSTAGRPCAPKSTALVALTAAMQQAVAESDPIEEARAFPIFDEVPPGHAMFRVDRGRHEPHLHDGEWVVIDTTAREIDWGELYLVLQSRGPVLWQITRHTDQRGRITPTPWSGGPPFAWMSPLSRPRFLPNGDLDPARTIYLSDGPISTGFLQPDILGRVVGIIDPVERFERQQRAFLLGKAAAEREARARCRPPQIEGRVP